MQALYFNAKAKQSLFHKQRWKSYLNSSKEQRQEKHFFTIWRMRNERDWFRLWDLHVTMRNSKTHPKGKQLFIVYQHYRLYHLHISSLQKPSLFLCTDKDIFSLGKSGEQESLCGIAVNVLDWLVGWLVGFYGISTFIGYLMPNPFLCK